MTQTNKNNFKRTVRICYPAGTGTLVIRTDLDWGRDINPVAVSSDGNSATFEIEAQQRFVHFKPCLIKNGSLHWAVGPDNLLIMAGKTFRRVEVPVPSSPVPRLCVRLPGPGRDAVTVLHDTDGNRKFNWTHDGIGFSANPKLGWSKPKAAAVATSAGAGLTSLRIVMNYRNGLMSVGPIKAAR